MLYSLRLTQVCLNKYKYKSYHGIFVFSSICPTMATAFRFFTAIVWSLLRTPLLRSSVVEYLPSIYKGLGPILSTEKDGGKEERGKEYHEMETTLRSLPGSQQHCHATLTSLLFTYCLGRALPWWGPILLGTATVIRGFCEGCHSHPSQSD